MHNRYGDCWRPPGMQESAFQYLRGVSAAIDILLISGDPKSATVIERVVPAVQTLRSDGVVRAIREAAAIKVHHFVDRGSNVMGEDIVVYDPYSGGHGRPSPSHSVWMVPLGTLTR